MILIVQHFQVEVCFGVLEEDENSYPRLKVERDVELEKSLL